MCDCCKLKTINENPMEMQNDIRSLAMIVGGCLYVDMSLNRYVSEKDDVRINELILELNANTDSADVSLVSEHVPIKYCPFCGEEL